MGLFIVFTLCFGIYIADSVATQAHHPIANLLFMLTMSLVLMIMYSLPSFCCNLAVFDIKAPGIFGYCACVLIGTMAGAGAAIKTHPDQHKAAAVPAIAGGVWMMLMLYAIISKLREYRPSPGHIAPIMISSWVWY